MYRLSYLLLTHIDIPYYYYKLQPIIYDREGNINVSVNPDESTYPTGHIIIELYVQFRLMRKYNVTNL